MVPYYLVGSNVNTDVIDNSRNISRKSRRGEDVRKNPFNSLGLERQRETIISRGMGAD